MPWSTILTVCFMDLHPSWWSLLRKALSPSCPRAKFWIRAICPSIWILIASTSACSYSNCSSLLLSGRSLVRFPAKSVFRSSCPLDRFRRNSLNWASGAGRSMLSYWRAIAKINSENMRDLLWNLLMQWYVLYMYAMFSRISRGKQENFWSWILQLWLKNFVSLRVLLRDSSSPYQVGHSPWLKWLSFDLLTALARGK